MEKTLMRIRSAAVLLFLVAACGTGLTDPDGGVPPDAGTETDAGPACEPLTCVAAGAECGALDDGCGGSLSCGGCTFGKTCGGGGTPYVCGSLPTESSDARCSNGADDDGDGLVDCEDPDCSGGLSITVCCVPTSCAAERASCGHLYDGCAEVLDCGTCDTGEVCDEDRSCVTPPAPPETTGGGSLGDLSGLAPTAWPMQGRSPTRQYRADFAGPRHTPSVKWAVTLSEDALPTAGELPLAEFNAPVVGADGTIYVARGNRLYAVSPDGALVWKWEASPAAGFEDGPVVDADGDVWVSSGRLYALRRDGTERCSAAVSGSFLVSPEGTVYVTGDDALVAVSQDCAVLWSTRIEGAGPATLHPNGALIVTRTGGLTAVDANGARLWSWAVGEETERPQPPVVLSNGLLVVVTGFQVNWLDRYGHAFRWWWFESQPTLPAIGPEGQIYVAAFDRVHAFDKSGNRDWMLIAPAHGGYTAPRTPVVDAEGNVYVWFTNNSFNPYVDRPLVSVSPQGELRWEKTVGHGSSVSPILHGPGRLLGLATYGTGPADDSYRLVMLE